MSLIPKRSHEPYDVIQTRLVSQSCSATQRKCPDINERKCSTDDSDEALSDSDDDVVSTQALEDSLLAPDSTTARVDPVTEWNKAVYRTKWADNGPSSVSPTHCDRQVESCWGSAVWPV